MQSLLSVRFGCHNLPLRFCWWLQKTKPTASSCLTVIRGDFLLGNSQERRVKVKYLCRLPRCFRRHVLRTGCLVEGLVVVNGRPYKASPFFLEIWKTIIFFLEISSKTHQWVMILEKCVGFFSWKFSEPRQNKNLFSKVLSWSQSLPAATSFFIDTFRGAPGWCPFFSLLFLVDKRCWEFEINWNWIMMNRKVVLWVNLFWVIVIPKNTWRFDPQFWDWLGARALVMREWTPGVCSCFCRANKNCCTFGSSEHDLN